MRSKTTDFSPFLTRVKMRKRFVYDLCDWINEVPDMLGFVRYNRQVFLVVEYTFINEDNSVSRDEYHYLIHPNKQPELAGSIRALENLRQEKKVHVGSSTYSIKTKGNTPHGRTYMIEEKDAIYAVTDIPPFDHMVATLVGVSDAESYIDVMVW